jgi:Ca-activated chloride channel family protein
MNMHFADPKWLLAGLVVMTILGVLLVRAEYLKARALKLLEGIRLPFRSSSPSRARRWLRILVVTFAVATGFVALARPQKGLHWETLERKGTDLLLVVDTSRSMDSDDLKPTRLERAKLAIRDLVQRFPGDRIGVVAFAGEAFVESPMTLDHTALLESVDALDTSVIARGGTNIGHGIDVAAAALATEPGHQKVMVLVTDGEDLEGQGLAEAKAAAATGITVDTVGVGTTLGELVPVLDAHGRATGIVHDENGQPVHSHLDEPGLRAIAAAGHGSYEILGQDGRGLERLYDESLAPLTHVEASSRTHRVYSEWFEVPLGLSVLALIFDALLGRRWRTLGAASRRTRRHSPMRVAAVAAAALVAIPGVAHASVTSASKAYAAGKYGDAAKEFDRQSQSDPKDPRLAFNAGDAAYRAGQLEAADAAFKRTVTLKDPVLQERSLYNEGDVLYRIGQAKAPEAREETIASWKSAIASYDAALALDSKDADAKFNRDFVARKLKELEEKPKGETKPKDDKKDDKGSKGDKKDKGAKSGDGDKKDSKGGSGQDGKGDKGGKDGKPGASGSQPSPGNPGADNGSPPHAPGQGHNGEPSSTGSPDGQSPSPGSATPPGTLPGQAGTRGQPPQGANGQEGSEGADGKDDGQPARLSARDARALLGALRGDERRGRSPGTDSGAAPIDDPPRKDW